MLDKLAHDDKEAYAGFWKECGRVLKEGPAEDHANRDKIARLLRFSTTHTDSETPDQSLVDYVARKQPDQDKIWYIIADSFAAARSSPHLEVFRKQGIEVLLQTDAIDEWLIGHLQEFEGLEFRDVKRGALDLGRTDGSEARPEAEAGEHAGFIARLAKQLDGQVQEVRATTRLTESPACLAIGEFDISAQMRRVMQATGQAVPEAKPSLEINVEHPLIRRLAAEQDERRFGDLAQLVFDQAHLAEGGQLKDPGVFVQRLNRILLEIGG
jgi:molecular chaperone HtpG